MATKKQPPTPKKLSTVPGAVVAGSLPPAQLRAIGDIMVRWSLLEFQLGNLAVCCLDIPKDAGRVLTIGMDIAVVLGVLKTAIHDATWVKDKDLRNDILAIVRDVMDSKQKRHAYAHGVYGFDLLVEDIDVRPLEFFRYLIYTAPDRIEPSIVALDLREMKEIAGMATEFSRRVTDATIAVLASRKKSAEPLLRRSQSRGPRRNR
jgi:hypothetical protein